MKRTYPKLEESMLLICESARREQYNKISLLGWYGGDDIVFYPEPGKGPPYMVASLSFVIVFRNVSGTFKTEFAVLDPDGETVFPQRQLKPSKFEGGRKGTVVVNIGGGVKFTKLGEYTVRLKLEKKTYEYKFKVKVGTPPKAT